MNIPIPTKIVPKMGDVPTPKWYQNGFDQKLPPSQPISPRPGTGSSPALAPHVARHVAVAQKDVPKMGPRSMETKTKPCVTLALSFLSHTHVTRPKPPAGNGSLASQGRAFDFLRPRRPFAADTNHAPQRYLQRTRDCPAKISSLRGIAHESSAEPVFGIQLFSSLTCAGSNPSKSGASVHHPVLEPSTSPAIYETLPVSSWLCVVMANTEAILKTIPQAIPWKLPGPLWKTLCHLQMSHTKNTDRFPCGNNLLTPTLHARLTRAHNQLTRRSFEWHRLREAYACRA